ncbi:uncharacterized protein LOC108595087 isoform X2 [Drosophila busckii]|uniref:uncharacterized protein LOC108595087 isoform X2 n=1 Tax=Drosophila busckii TaxID=30019 RepID=UPI00083F1051|nr:uncharacterized protein LOC108595087 isoform X2 [Drosophila busckii]
MHVEKKSELRNMLKSGDKRCKLVEPRNAKSCVWRFFNLVSCDDKIEPYACCKSCGDLLSYSGKTGTGSLLRHRCLHTTNEKTSRISKAKVAREPIRMAKPKIETHSSITGALPQKWEEYEQHEEIGEDIKDIIYSEDPLCYSPIQVIEDGSIGTKEKVTIVTSNRASTAPVVATVVSASTSSAAKTLKNNLETSIERLTTVSEQLTYVIQQQQDNQAKDDDYYFALSLVPIFRELSLTRKLYVRSKIHELLYKESEDSLSKDE